MPLEGVQVCGDGVDVCAHAVRQFAQCWRQVGVVDRLKDAQAVAFDDAATGFQLVECNALASL